MTLSLLKSKIGALVREAGVYGTAAGQSRNQPTVLFLPSQGLDDGAARLRAYAIAAALRTLHWRSFTCPKHLGLAARHRLARLLKPDVIVMQTARHPLNRPRLFPGIPVVMDLDDADYIDPVSAEPLVEALQTSVAVIAGSRAVACFCKQHNERVTTIWTGTPPSPRSGPSQVSRQRIITWAASSPVGSRGEARFVRGILDRLIALKIDFVFRVYCDDGSPAYRRFLDDLAPKEVRLETMPYLAYPQFLSSLESVAVGLAPLIDTSGFSGGKSFGKVLAYIDRGVPVVTHPVVDHPLFFKHGETGLMASTEEEWADAIISLLAAPEARQDMAMAAHADFLRRLTTETAARLVDQFLRKLISL